MKNILTRKYLFPFAFLLFFGCSMIPVEKARLIPEFPHITPDYIDITIPPNIAPLNFLIKEEASRYIAQFSNKCNILMVLSSKNGKIIIPMKKWKKILNDNINQELHITILCKDDQEIWKSFKPFTMKIAPDPIDPYMSYRLLYPGYEAYVDLNIQQRCLENFKVHSIIENSIIDNNCINCHTFNPKNNSDFFFHVRGSFGDTYFYKDRKLKRYNLKSEEMKYNPVYPRWHPSGKFIAFSSNKTGQLFHASENKKVEVIDVASSLILYNIDSNKISPVDLPKKELYMDTYPEWGPDGKYLYFCRANIPESELDYQDIKYNLYRIPFDEESQTFGLPELIFDALGQFNKSVSFPRISPNGNFLVFTLHDYGCFSIWHKDADLYSLNLENMEISKMSLNSDYTESYHSWSSNNKWLAFSSKRIDGLTARPYISYIYENGESCKAFVLPQKDPEFYDSYLKTYNIPELSKRKIVLTPGEIRKTAKSETIQTN